MAALSPYSDFDSIEARSTSAGMRAPREEVRDDRSHCRARGLGAAARLRSTSAIPAIYQQDTWRPLFARLRREAPVHYCAESRYGPYWSVTRYNDIMTVELDHATYSSQLGGIQVEDQPADMKRGSFIRMDPPRHTAQRKTVAPVAAPINLASYEVTIRERTRAVLDALAPQRDLRLGGQGLDRAHDHDAGDAVRLPLGGAAQAHLLVGRRHLQRRRARRARSFGGGALCRASAHGRCLQGALAESGRRRRRGSTSSR